MRLIVTADDFGLTDGVSSGIVRGLTEGIVTSTSCMVCTPAACDRLTRWREALSGRAGVHLQMTDGAPVTGPERSASLLNGDGGFPRFPYGIGAFDPRELRREWEAQVQRFLRSGLTPTHIDTHHHVHSIPAVFEVYCDVACAYGLPARTLTPDMSRELRKRGVPCADVSTGWSAVDGESFLTTVRRMLDACGDRATLEIMTHPAHVDSELGARSVYTTGRAQELEVLSAPELRSALAQLGVELIPMSAAGSAA